MHKAINMIDEFLKGLVGDPDIYFNVIKAAFTEKDKAYNLLKINEEMVINALIAAAISENLIHVRKMIKQGDIRLARNCLWVSSRNAISAGLRAQEGGHLSSTEIYFNVLLDRAWVKCNTLLEQLNDALSNGSQQPS